jgi:GNAT superfamily N-acetyltransferase
MKLEYKITYRGLYAEHPMGNGKPMHYFVAEKHGEEIGFALFDQTGHLDTMNVKEEYQRQGIGTDMWTFAKETLGWVGHAEYRTRPGDAWARKIGGELPLNLIDWAEQEREELNRTPA